MLQYTTNDKVFTGREGCCSVSLQPEATEALREEVKKAALKRKALLDFLSDSSSDEGVKV